MDARIMAGDEVCREARERYAAFLERERPNIDAAYEDLAFVFEDKQWPDVVVRQREAEERPVLTINRMSQFLRQVTGDMRQMKPGIKVVPVDSRGDKDVAETIAGMIRYVENRSDATAVYLAGADTQVCAGIGHWRVTREYAGESTFNQELRIVGVSDGISIAWDPDAEQQTREDAQWCLVPVDMSHEKFKKAYPDAPLEDFDSLDHTETVGWYDKDFVRVGEYWVKKPVKRTLALLPDGSVDDLTDEPPERIEELRATIPGIRVEKRDGHKVVRYLVTAAHILEGPDDWPGMYIPIVRCVGEEVRSGRKIVRRGLIRSAKDSQRMFNYFCSAHAEVVALQPKAPFIGTEKNFEKYLQEWSEANTKAHPFLPYEPDAKNGGAAPQRVAPPVSSQGITEGIQLSIENMKGTIGIYDAGLGNRSNETSGKAILARQREGDIGTAHYIDNWSRAIRHTGKILVDLIPHVYDAQRTIRVMGEDGKVDLKEINKPSGIQVSDPITGQLSAIQKIENDVKVGAYDIVLETGPSFTTKREEAKESLREFIQASPDSAALLMDLYAKMQDWPLADEVTKRYEAVAPDPVKKLISQQKQEQGDEALPPSPEEQQAQQMQMAAAQMELQAKHLANQKTQVEIAKIASEAGGEGEQQQLAIEQQKAAMDLQMKQVELETKRELAAIDIQIKLADLEIKRQQAQLKTDEHAMTMAMDHERHQHAMARGAEAHSAKVQQMNNRPHAE
jgi:hypothetical protein